MIYIYIKSSMQNQPLISPLNETFEQVIEDYASNLEALKNISIKRCRAGIEPPTSRTALRRFYHACNNRNKISL